MGNADQREETLDYIKAVQAYVAACVRQRQLDESLLELSCDTLMLLPEAGECQGAGLVIRLSVASYLIPSRRREKVYR